MTLSFHCCLLFFFDNFYSLALFFLIRCIFFWFSFISSSNKFFLFLQPQFSLLSESQQDDHLIATAPQPPLPLFCHVDVMHSQIKNQIQSGNEHCPYRLCESLAELGHVNTKQLFLSVLSFLPLWALIYFCLKQKYYFQIFCENCLR